MVASRRDNHGSSFFQLYVLIIGNVLASNGDEGVVANVGGVGQTGVLTVDDFVVEQGHL